MLLQGLLISLQKTYQGVGISAGLLQPEHKGGDKQDISIFGGYGDLDEDGFNIFGVVDYRRTNGIMAKDRKISERGGVLPELGLDGRSANAFTSNFMILYLEFLEIPMLKMVNVWAPQSQQKRDSVMQILKL